MAAAGSAPIVGSVGAPEHAVQQVSQHSESGVECWDGECR